MGGAVSAGLTNDELIDNLLEADYIKTPQIERVFRAVDRGEYYLAEPSVNAYKDLAWRNGHYHISAPCIYSEVLEGLRLEAGMSFLNLGSGTGYLSTMVGLILGSHGINHGVELHADVVDYARKKLHDFKLFSGAIDEYDFCEPKFVQGNCFCLTSDCYLYDRVYCGASCPEEYMSYMKNLIKVGGILIVPLNDELLEITRTSETDWNINPLLPVSFASFILPKENQQETVRLFDVDPMSLQELCRVSIRQLLRQLVSVEHPPVKKVVSSKINKQHHKKKNSLPMFVLPLFDSDDRFNSSESGERTTTTNHYNNNISDSSLSVNNNDTDTAASSSTSSSLMFDARDTDTQYPVGVVAAAAAAATTSTTERKSASDFVAEMIDEASDNLSLSDRLLSLTRSMLADNDDDSSSSSSDDPHKDCTPNKRCTKLSKAERRSGPKWRKIDLKDCNDSNDDGDNNNSSSNNNATTDADDVVALNEMRMFKSAHTAFMRDRIQQLPLPSFLKNYLNFYRDF